jgi:glutathione synthase/RimK-type ligase-like ATP-grasp enzyme
VLLDLSRFPRRQLLALAYAGTERDFRFTAGRRSLRASDVGAVWWRRPQPFALHPEVRRGRRDFAYRECTEAFQGLWQSLAVLWVNPPVSDEAASHKPFQLTMAQRMGLAVPRTLVTNDPARARDFVRSCRPGAAVFKALSATLEDWRETRLVRQEELSKLHLVRYAPIIFQEYVEGADLRVTAVGDRLFAAAIHAEETEYPVDFRIDFDRARVEPVDLPETVARRLRRLVRALGLAYAAIDMRRGRDGRHLFLEANPSGQFLFVERRTGQPITAALADLLGSGTALPR